MTVRDDMSVHKVQRDARLAMGIVAGVVGAAVIATIFVSIAPPMKRRPVPASTVLPHTAALKINLANDVAAAVASAEASAAHAETIAAQAEALAAQARSGPARGAPVVKLSLPGGFAYRGEGESGVAEGVGVVTGGKIAFGAGYFVGGARNGVGVDCARADCSGPAYFGDFREGRATGAARIVFDDGAVYRGDVVDGTPHGFGEVKHPDGSRYIGEFTMGRRDGHGEETSAAGVRKRGFWVADQLSEVSPS